jgi:hypothetical protein
MSDPIFGYSSSQSMSNSQNEIATSTVFDTCDPEIAAMRSAVSSINRLRPRFVVISGALTWTATDANLEAVKKIIARISETIPVLLVPGSSDMGSPPSVEGLERYRKNFGADHYGFWYSGVRCLIINSNLFVYSDVFPVEALAQDIWFEEEIEQAKMCSTQLLIFSHHPWKPVCSCPNNPFPPECIPAEISDKWLKQLRHEKVSFKLPSIF